MTAVSDIIYEAFQESAMLSDTQYPTRTQFNKALTRLQRIIDGVYGHEIGAPLVDWNLGDRNRTSPMSTRDFQASEQYPPQNSRLVANNEAALTVYLPSDPSNGARLQIVDPFSSLGTYAVTLDANGRTIEAAATLAPTTDGRTWMYRADEGDWVRIATLAGTDTFPFPSAVEDFFIIKLAKRLNPKYGAVSHPDTERRLAEATRVLRALYRQTNEEQLEAGLVDRRQLGHTNFARGAP